MSRVNVCKWTGSGGRAFINSQSSNTEPVQGLDIAFLQKYSKWGNFARQDYTWWPDVLKWNFKAVLNYNAT